MSIKRIWKTIWVKLKYRKRINDIAELPDKSLIFFFVDGTWLFD